MKTKFYYIVLFTIFLLILPLSIYSQGGPPPPPPPGGGGPPCWPPGTCIPIDTFDYVLIGVGLALAFYKINKKKSQNT